MKVQIKEIVPGAWAVHIVGSMGAAAGRTTYSSLDEAKDAAIAQHPGAEIEIVH
jgi:hypothetical protein